MKPFKAWLKTEAGTMEPWLIHHPDKERLDWIIKHEAETEKTDIDKYYCHWWDADPMSTDPRTGPCKTAREAIDAARGKE